MLTIRNLTKVYPGPVAALQGVDLDIGEGMFGLLGPNGAGKTTLMRILAGLLEPTAGSVTLDGEDAVAHPERVWARLGYLPQEFGFYPHLTGEVMLRHLLKLKGVEAPRGLPKLAGELLDRVNLTFAAKRKVKTYSGGMRQRLGLAQAIAGDPSLIIVDEPTAGLDPEERLRFYRLLAELAEDRVVVLSTHIVEDVSDLCPRMAIMGNGRILVDGEPAALIDRLVGRLWKRLVAPAAVAELRTELPIVSTRMIAGQVEIRVVSATQPDGLASAEPNLEDVYFATLAEHGIDSVLA